MPHTLTTAIMPVVANSYVELCRTIRRCCGTLLPRVNSKKVVVKAVVVHVLFSVQTKHAALQVVVTAEIVFAIQTAMMLSGFIHFVYLRD
jgi:hypothetical protein